MSNNKQSIKLYTEEELKKFMQKHVILDELTLSLLTPIELPSDEEIEEESPYVPNDASLDFWAHKEGFVDGAKWMRDKIQGGNK